MTTCTPIYGIPYTEGSDRPCDFDTQSCATAEAIEEQLDAVDAIVARTQGTVPFAYACSVSEQTYNSSAPGTPVVTIDTTLVDTNNMIDISFDNTSIYFNTPGVYNLYFSIEMHLPGGLNNFIAQPLAYSPTGSSATGVTFQAQQFTPTTGMPITSTGGRVPNCCATGEFQFNVPSPGYHYNTQIFPGGALNVNYIVVNYRIGALWLRDPL